MQPAGQAAGAAAVDVRGRLEPDVIDKALAVHRAELARPAPQQAIGQMGRALLW
ncbi:hypothetical protein [Nonomuraea typhae]|uniref:Uncharacterized protein n=1 Tax=Nonomuraea typhae TaxID=2603600 RepID=A0ABW7ZCP1_9ACTN